MSKSSKPVPIALPNEMVDQIRQICDLTQMSQQEVMRWAMRVGIEDLRRIDYNIAGAIVDKAKSTATIVHLAPPDFAALDKIVAEPAITYASAKKGKLKK